MQRHEIRELHYITSVRNLRSIARHGIRCHNRMTSTEHVSVANPGVQEIRAKKTIVGGGRLHDYANLYFDARNPMMYRLRRIEGRGDLIVVRVSPNCGDRRQRRDRNYPLLRSEKPALGARSQAHTCAIMGPPRPFHKS